MVADTQVLISNSCIDMHSEQSENKLDLSVTSQKGVGFFFKKKILNHGQRLFPYLEAPEIYQVKENIGLMNSAPYNELIYS